MSTRAPSKTAATKSPSKAVVAKAPAKAAASKTPSKSAKQQKVIVEVTEAAITPEDRLEMISEAAYYISAQYGFDPSRNDLNWLQAEKEVDSMLLNKHKH